MKLRDKFGRGGTDVGVARARQLAAGEPLSEADVRSIYSYFARHAVDKDAKAREWGDESDPSAGFIAWLLWGGDAGKAWAEGKHARLEKAKAKG
ncbi:hypothetical protein [Qipengyuania sediminis]|uniref:hypothetical protein n=1 Tax=Qipengyuania sediminis TaxID=1532023 RepID=UPI00197E120F|nr:hypothetical protein [Qipengyuania sediminis]